MLASDVADDYSLYFRYDQNGAPIGFAYEGDVGSGEYYYLKNLQGDITGIVDTSGNRVATYVYDAWGNHLSITGSNTDLANKNPLRYRGYVYDTESSLYYLQSRYYSPAIGRFISADSYAMTYETPVGANMFAYCMNNPVSMADDGGKCAHIVIGAAVGAAISAVTTMVESYKRTGKIDVGDTIVSGVVGALNGGIAATGAHFITQAIVSGVVAMAGVIASQTLVQNKGLKDVNYAKVLHNGILASVTSVLGSGLGAITSSGYATTGKSLISQGNTKLSIANSRMQLGKSSSSLRHQGDKLISLGENYIKTGRGISSVTGSFLTWGVSQEWKWS